MVPVLVGMWILFFWLTYFGIYFVMLPLDDRWAGVLDRSDKDWQVFKTLFPETSANRFALRTLAYGRAVVSNRYAFRRFKISRGTLRESLGILQIAYCYLLALCSRLLWPTLILMILLAATSLLFPSVYEYAPTVDELLKMDSGKGLNDIINSASTTNIKINEMIDAGN
jgi:hypothetical protein